MSTTIAIKAIISAVDKITAPIRKIASSVRDKLGGAFKSIGKGIGASIGKLSDWAMSATKYLAIGAAAIVAGLGAAGMAYLDNAGHLADMTAQLGISAEALQELYYAAKLAGIGSEELDGALAALSKGVGQAKAGTGRFYAFLGKVSPQLQKQVRGAKSTEEAFDLVVAAIAKLPDTQRKAALASAAFGGAGQSLIRIIGEGPEALEKLRAEFRKTGAMLSGEQVAAADELGDSLDKLKTTIGGAANAVLGELVPVLQPLVTQLTDWIAANREILKLKVEEVFSAIGEAIASVDWPATIKAALDFGQAMREVLDAIGGVSGALTIFGGLVAINLIAKLAFLLPILKGIWAAIVFLGSVVEVFAAVTGIAAAAIVGAFALLGIAAVLVIRNWQDFVDFGAELWRTLKVLWIDGTGFIGARWDDLTKGLLAGWEAFGKGIAPLVDGVVSIFTAAWDVIGAIVDKIGGAVSSVLGAAGSVADALGFGGDAPAAGGGPARGPGGHAMALGPALAIPGGPALATAAGGGGTAQVSGGVTVRFEGAPPGLRVEETRSDTPGLAVSASVGRRSLATGGAL